MGSSGPRNVNRGYIYVILAAPRAAVIGIFRAILTYDPVTPLRRYSGPTLSVITPLNNASFSLHRLIRGTGHWPQMDKPDQLNGLIDAFLEGVIRASR